jgi:hypothetical protein
MNCGENRFPARRLLAGGVMEVIWQREAGDATAFRLIMDDD